jgi:hypothetical protein
MVISPFHELHLLIFLLLFSLDSGGFLVHPLGRREKLDITQIGWYTFCGLNLIGNEKEATYEYLSSGG